MEKEKLKAGLILVHVFVLLIVSAMIFGDVVRGSYSPWIWDEYYRLKSHGTPEVIVGISLYLFAYSASFFLPYYILSAAFWIKYGLDWRDERAFDASNVKVGIAFIAFSCFITFMFFLKSIIAFIRNVNTDTWNGWLFILWLASCFFFLFGGLTTLKKAKDKLHIKVHHDSEIFSRCPKCGCESTFPADDLRAKNIVFRR